MSKDNTNNIQARKKYRPQFKDQAVERAAKDGILRSPKILVSKSRRFTTGVPRKTTVTIQLKTKS